MPDINTNLQRLQDDSAEIESLVDDIVESIADSGGVVSPTGGLRSFPTAIESIPIQINAKLEPEVDLYDSILSGGSPVPTTASGVVRFFDYDGSIVATYTSRQFLALTSLPANPTHEGLTSQGWNWSLSDAKEYVTDYGSLDIGQMYVTADGSTRLHIRLGDGRLKPYLGLTGDSSGTTVSIDWGDGSAAESVTLNTTTVYTSHEYTTSGEYTISISVTTGSITLIGDSTYNSNILRKSSTPNANDDRVYQNSLIGVEFGNNVSIGNNTFYNCFSLTSITIPDGITTIENNAFSGCRSLQSITIPDTVTSIGTQAFYQCYSLQSITIPDSVTTIGSNAFYNCYSLTSITIPDTVTTIENNAFSGCCSLQSITIPDTVTSIGNSAFYQCYSLTSINIPDGVTIIGNKAFQYCYSLTSITIPDTVTTIAEYTFQLCFSLTSITIPDTVTSIGTYTFQNCHGLGSIKFERLSPPTVSSSSAFTNLPTDCKIYVPSGSLAAYTTATNYPSSSTYTYIEY